MQKKNYAVVLSSPAFEKTERKGIRELTPDEIELVSGSHDGAFNGDHAAIGGAVGYFVGGGYGAAAGTLIGGFGQAAASAQSAAIAANVKAGIAAGSIGI